MKKPKSNRKTPTRKNTLLERMRRVTMIAGWRAVWGIDVYDSGRPVSKKSLTGSAEYDSLEEACEAMRHFQKFKLKPRLKLMQFAP